MGLNETLRSLLKAHVKGHTRVVNGKVIYIHDYDSSKPQGRAAELHERTTIGKHRSGTHYLRATDAEDGTQIQATANRLGIKTDKRRAGANHFGRVGAYDHYHVESPEHALAIHEELKKLAGKGAPEMQEPGPEAKVAAKKAAPKDHTEANIVAHDAEEESELLQGKGDKAAHAHARTVSAHNGTAFKHPHPTTANLHELAAQAHREAHAENGEEGHLKAAEHHDTLAAYHHGEGKKKYEAFKAKQASDYESHRTKAKEASEAAHTASLTANTKDEHARALGLHHQAMLEHQEAGKATTHAGRKSMHEANFAEHSDMINGHSARMTTGGGKDATLEARAASNLTRIPDKDLKPEDYDKAIAAHNRAGSAHVVAMDKGQAGSRAHHSSQADQHAQDARTIEAMKAEHLKEHGNASAGGNPPSEDSNGTPKLRAHNATRVANELSEKANNSNSPEDHTAAAEAHEKARILHHEAQPSGFDAPGAEEHRFAKKYHGNTAETHKEKAKELSQPKIRKIVEDQQAKEKAEGPQGDSPKLKAAKAKNWGKPSEFPNGDMREILHPGDGNRKNQAARKPSDWDEAVQESGPIGDHPDEIGALKHLHAAHGTHWVPKPLNDINDHPHRENDTDYSGQVRGKRPPMEFIAKDSKGRHFYVNTEGGKYARYARHIPDEIAEKAGITTPHPMDKLGEAGKASRKVLDISSEIGQSGITPENHPRWTERESLSKEAAKLHTEAAKQAHTKGDHKLAELHEKWAKSHGGSTDEPVTVKPAEEPKGHAIPKPTTMPPLAGARPSDVAEHGAQASDLSRKAEALKNGAGGYPHERAAITAHNATLNARVGSLQAASGGDHGRAALLHTAAAQAHGEAATAAKGPMSDGHEMIASGHSDLAKKHAAIADASNAEKEANKARAKAKLPEYTAKANEAGKKAFAMTRKGNDDPDGEGKVEGHHDVASKLHAHAANLHREAREMAHTAGEAQPLLYHDEMSNHHSEAHVQHKHEIEHPGQVARAGTQQMIRAASAFEKHYGENKPEPTPGASAKDSVASTHDGLTYAQRLAGKSNSPMEKSRLHDAGHSSEVAYATGGKQDHMKAHYDHLAAAGQANHPDIKAHHEKYAQIHKEKADAIVPSAAPKPKHPANVAYDEAHRVPNVRINKKNWPKFGDNTRTSTQKVTKDATDATTKAEGSGTAEDHQAASDAHWKAAQAHEIAYSGPGQTYYSGHSRANDAHMKAGIYHQQKAMEAKKAGKTNATAAKEPPLAPEAKDYDKRVRAYEKKGMSRSDAQGVVDAEDMKARSNPSGKAEGASQAPAYPNLKGDAKKMGLHEFLDKHNIEHLNEHLDNGLTPSNRPHAELHPDRMDPSEWDDWDEHKTWAGNTMPTSKKHIEGLRESIRKGAKTNPVLVDHQEPGKYRPQVIDGHHRVAAHKEENKPAPVGFNAKTLAGTWASENGKPNTQKDRDRMESEYRAHLATKPAALKPPAAPKGEVTGAKEKTREAVNNADQGDGGSRAYDHKWDNDKGSPSTAKAMDATHKLSYVDGFPKEHAEAAKHHRAAAREYRLGERDKSISAIKANKRADYHDAMAEHHETHSKK